MEEQIYKIIKGHIPPKNPYVLWLDLRNPYLVLKAFNADGAWKPVGGSTGQGSVNSSDIPTKVSLLINDAGYSTFSGDYNDLTNTPELDLSMFELVETLPTENINLSKVYLTKDTEASTDELDVYKLNKYIDGTWSVLGSYKTSIDLSGYVEKETGKGLFSGNYNDLTNKPNLDQYLLKTNAVQKASSVCSDANSWLTNGYATTSASLPTANLPSVCTGADRWGVIFYMALNESNKAGFQLYYPIDGTYKGRIFYRSVASTSATAPVNLTFSAWELIPKSSDIPSITGLETSLHASDTYVKKSSISSKELVFVKEDGSTETIKCIVEV